MVARTSPLRVLFAEDQVMFRECFVTYAKSCLPIAEHYEASNGIEALEILHRFPVDLVFLDMEMPLMDGETCMRIINKQFKHVKVIVVTVLNRGSDIKKMLDAGARSYVVKNMQPKEILLAVEAVMAGKLFFDSQVTKILLQDQIQPNQLKANETPVKLTEREIQILNLVAQGLHSKEIADALSTSKQTVDKQRKMLLEKIEGRGIADMIRFGLRSGVIGIKNYLGAEKSGSTGGINKMK